MKNGPSDKAAPGLSSEHDTAKRCNRGTLQDGNGSPRLSCTRQYERPAGKGQRRHRTCAAVNPLGSLDPDGDGGELPGRQLLLSSQRSRLRGWICSSGRDPLSEQGQCGENLPRWSGLLSTPGQGASDLCKRQRGA